MAKVICARLGNHDALLYNDENELYQPKNANAEKVLFEYLESIMTGYDLPNPIVAKWKIQEVFVKSTNAKPTLAVFVDGVREDYLTNFWVVECGAEVA